MPRFLANRHARPLLDAAAPDRSALHLHRRLPGYAPTPLHHLAPLAKRLGLGAVLLKDEASRLGLPAFKVLGASWAVYRIVCERLGAEPAWRTLDDLRRAAAPLHPLTLTTATDGNHGRAVARVAALFGFSAVVFVPRGTAAARIAAIAAEGARVEVVPGSYDDAVLRAQSEGTSARTLVVSDTGWPGYTTIPTWIAEGYATLFHEVDDSLAARGEPPPDLVLAPIGVGALAEAIVRRYRCEGSPSRARIVGVEPDSAACALASVAASRMVTVPGPHPSILAGLNCGTPSLTAWPFLRDGIDAYVSVDDARAGEAVRLLAAAGIASGETGAAGVAGLLEIVAMARGESAHAAGADAVRALLPLGPTTRVLLLSTEGITDPAGHAGLLRGHDVSNGDVAPPAEGSEDENAARPGGR